MDHYLQERFGALSFLDKRFYSIDERHRWSKCSPQHLRKMDLVRLFPQDWIASSFAVVRNPFDRVVSAYNFATLAIDSIPVGESIIDWLMKNDPRRPEAAFAYDNHLCMQTDLVPDDAVIFCLEDGLEAVIHHIDTLAQDNNGPRTIAHQNSTSEFTSDIEIVSHDMPQEFFDLVGEIYASDFERFGYDPHDYRSLNTMQRKQGYIAKFRRRLKPIWKKILPFRS